MSRSGNESAAESHFSGFAKPAEESQLPQLSAGSLLRGARERAGLHIATLAVALKVPVKKLEALEQDRLDLLPDAVFARALVASVCRNLKVDPVPILDRLPQAGLPRLTLRDQRLQPAFRTLEGPQGRQILTSVSRPAFLAGLVLLAGAAVMIFLPDVKSLSSQVYGKASSVLASRSPDNAPLVLDMSSTSSFPRQASSANDAVPGIAVGNPALPVLDNRAAVANAGVVPSSTLTAQRKAGEPGDILTLSATRESWVRVTDAKGAVVLRRLLAAGETATVSGALPLEAVVGRADATRVEIRGKVLDLAPLARDNVARFEVK
jgi:cytoskeleton protein RodZ